MKIKEETYYEVVYEDEIFIRFSSKGWYQFYGESIEPVYHHEKLEEEFQNQLTSK